MHAPRYLVPAVTAIALLGGCVSSSPPPRREAGIGVEHRAQALFAPHAASSNGDEWDAPEYTRRDYRMSIASATSPTALDQWPTDPQPSLAFRGSVFLNTRQFGETVIFFQPDHVGRRGGYWHERGWHD